MGARGIGHLRELVRDRPRPTSRWCSTSARRTSASSAPRTTSRTAKGELVEALPRPTASAVLNADDPRVAAMARAHRGAGARPSASSRRRRRARLEDERLDGPTAAPPSRLAARRRSGARCALRPARRPPRRSTRPPPPRSRSRSASPLDDGGRARWARSTPLSRWRMELHERADGRDRGQRRLQRQPRLDARPRSRRWPRSARGGGGPHRSPCSARCASWASRRRQEHDAVGRLAVRPRRHASWSWSGEARRGRCTRGALTRGGRGERSRSSWPTTTPRSPGCASTLRAGRRRAGQGVARRPARRGRRRRCSTTPRTGSRR